MLRALESGTPHGDARRGVRSNEVAEEASPKRLIAGKRIGGRTSPQGVEKSRCCGTGGAYCKVTVHQRRTIAPHLITEVDRDRPLSHAFPAKLR
jgi:hypothetical protein